MNENNLSTDNYEEETIETNEYEEVTTEEVEDTYSSSNNNNTNANNEFRSKMIKMFGIVIIGLIIFLVIGFVISLVTKKDYTYSALEDEMKKAAINYFKDNKSKLPKTNTEIVEIDASILAKNKYMKTLDKYMKDEECTGKVTVEKVDDSYSYTPYLSCNDGGYTTTKFYKKIANSSNVVTEGFGLYYINNEYVYRGKDVNNYVRFSDSEIVWRVVKVTSNNEVVLVTEDKTKNRFTWDSRYNNVKQRNTGINLYKNSEISTTLDSLYNNKIGVDDSYREELKLLTKDDKTKLVEFDACVGTRSQNDTTKNGSSECKVKEKTKVSLLTTYDYLNASLDVNCNSTIKKDCQNYNYLSTGYIFWLGNGVQEDNSKVYQVSSSGYILTREASRDAAVRVVVHVGDNAMLEKGNGTKTNPYIIR